MPRAFGRRMRKKRGPDKLDFADISLMLLAAHKKNIFDEKDAEQKLMYDLYYIKNWSIWLEIEICFKTLLVILDKKGF